MPRYRANLTLYVVGVVLASLFLHVHANIGAASASFTVVVLPDTQNYVAHWASTYQSQLFIEQTRWIAANVAAERIAFVAHEGDLVESGGTYPVEWQRADAAMDVLDGVVPYAAVLGNHDFDQVSNRGGGATSYLSNFGPARYQGYSWYGGSSSNGLNQYQLFQAGGWTFLHLALELEAPDSAIAWAQRILDQHPTLPAIVTTHSYQRDDIGRTPSAQYGGNAGEQIWQKLITRNPRIFIVLNGHFNETDGERHQVSLDDAGLEVFEMMADYQDYPNGGSGYLRLLRFDPANQQIQVRSFSPTLDQYMTDADSEFTFSIDFDQRFAVAAMRPTFTPTPTAAHLIRLPGRVEAENYRLGGSGWGYLDTTAGNSGGVYRNDDVDVERCSDGSPCYDVGYIATGEWLAYNTNVTASGSYVFRSQVSSIYSGKRFHIEVDGVNVTGALTVPNTGSWNTWATVTSPAVALAAGPHTITFVAESSWFNLNYVTVSGQ